MNTYWLFALSLGLLAAGAACAAVSLFVRDVRSQRYEDRIARVLDARQRTPEPEAATPPPQGIRARSLHLIQAIGQRFEGTRVERLLLAGEDRLLLGMAGWNTTAGTSAFIGVRIVLAALCMQLAIVLFPSSGLQMLFVLGGGLAVGVLLPKIMLGIWAARLRRKAYNELPLLIDLVRLLQGVGFSIDQTLHMLGEKLGPALPLLGRELRDANLAYSHGRSRTQSLHRLSETYDNEDLRSLVLVLLQVHEHGGAVQEPLRQFGVRLREQRQMESKEKIGKLSVKMTIVMMLTLLPALMIVLAGPAIIALAGTLTRMGGQ